jgi:hypothetical protein
MVDLRRLRLVGGDRKIFQLQEPPRSGVFALYGVRPAQAAVAPCSPTSAFPCSPPSALPCSTPSALLCSSSSVLAASKGCTPAAAAVVASVTPNYSAILAEFPDVVNEKKDLPPVTHKVEHFIETEGRPVSSKYHCLDPDRLAAAKAEKQGVVRRSSSNWASPLHMVKNSDGTWRPCGDFRRLNLQTKEDRYTCPNIADLTAQLAG